MGVKVSAGEDGKSFGAGWWGWWYKDVNELHAAELDASKQLKQ